MIHASVMKWLVVCYMYSTGMYAKCSMYHMYGMYISTYIHTYIYVCHVIALLDSDGAEK